MLFAKTFAAALSLATAVGSAAALPSGQDGILLFRQQQGNNPSPGPGPVAGSNSTGGTNSTSGNNSTAGTNSTACPTDSQGRPVGGVNGSVVPRECLTAQAVAPPGGTRNVTGNPNPLGADLAVTPDYSVKSDFDAQSLMLAAHQEDIERELFAQAVNNFTIADWMGAGLNETDVALIAFMARQEVDHKQALANMLGDVTPGVCNYTWPFGPHDVVGFLEYAFLNTRFGESGTIGWIPLLDNRASGNIIIQAITTESRQEMTFRQYLGLFPYPVAFEAAIPQPWHWTLLSKWISSCPANNTPLAWPILPSLSITNGAPIARNAPYITHNVTNLSEPGNIINVTWEEPGAPQGPYNQTTTTNATGPATHALIVSQLNATSVPLTNVNATARTASFVHPNGQVFSNSEPLFNIVNPVINGTVFVALLDGDYFYTPENISLSTQHIVAGPTIWVVS